MSSYSNQASYSLDAASALEKGVFVTQDGSGDAALAGPEDQVIGVTAYSAAAGEPVKIIASGLTDVQASAALTTFNGIGPDSNGRAQDAADGVQTCAMTLEESGVAASGSNYSYVKCLLMLQPPGEELRKLDITVGAESSDVIDLTLQQNQAAADTWRAVVIGQDDGLPEEATAFHLGATTGTEVTTTDQSGLIFDLTSDGEAVLEVTDVSGGSGSTVTVIFYPLDSPGVIERQDVTFD